MADPVVNIILKANDQTKGVLGNLGSKLGGIGKIALGVAAAGLGAFTIAAVKGVGAASDLSETINKSNVIFGDAAWAVQNFAMDAANGLGQSQQAALDAAATFGIFGKAAGLTGQDLADFSTGFTGLASDLASFNNTSPEDAVLAIGAALRGESEPLRRYGVLLDDASMRQKALELGIISTTKEALTPQQKVLAAQALIYEQTADAQGDFARTSEGLANSQRIVQAQLANLSATFGQIFLPIVEKFFAFLSTSILPALNNLSMAFQDAGLFSSEFQEALGAIVGEETAAAVMAFLQQLSEWLGVMVPKAIQFLKDAWSNVLLPAIQAVWQWMSTVLLPFLVNVVFPWLQVNIPKALQFLSDVWTNILWPAIQAVWNWMSTVLIPFLTDVVFPWLQTNIPKALQFLSNVWTNVLRPAIEAVWNWLSTVLIPFLRDVVKPWLDKNIPAAIQTLSDFWNNILLPAIKAIWDFIDTYLMPIFMTVKDILEVGLKIAIAGLADIWENVLLPALNKIWEFVDKYVTPALTWLLDKVVKPLTTALDTGLKNALKFINDALKVLKDLLDKIHLPGWMTPGSPTPLETGIRGITSAMLDLNRMALPGLSLGLATVSAGPSIGAGARVASAQPSNRLTVYGGLHLHNVEDGQDLFAALNDLMIG